MKVVETVLHERGGVRIFCSPAIPDEQAEQELEQRKAKLREEGWVDLDGNCMIRDGDSIGLSLRPMRVIGGQGDER